MAGRGRTSYQKRQKEQARLEKRQQKAARKQERKAGKHEPGDSVEPVDSADPESPDFEQPAPGNL